MVHFYFCLVQVITSGIVVAIITPAAVYAVNKYL